MDLMDIQDSVENASKKLAFIEDFFTQPLVSGETPSFSSDGVCGLGLILRDINDDLAWAVTELSQRQQKEVRL